MFDSLLAVGKGRVDVRPADLLRDSRKLVSGVILTAAEEDLTVLAPLLAVVA